MEFIGAEIQLTELAKRFEEVTAVNNVSLLIEGGKFLTLLGPSGSGKTTILMMVAGFITPTHGEIFVNGRNITNLAPFKREIGMTFQNYALFPHLTVFQNIAFPLQMRRMEKKSIGRKVGWALDLVRLAGYEKRYPKQLSGGQQQRVALARSLVFSPSLLLMDEPLGALDKKLREHMQSEIKHIQKDLNITVIYVTHDQEEALTMSDQIAIMNQGCIEQIATPNIIYERPANEFVANFIGESNIIEGEYFHEREGTSVIQTTTGIRIKLPKSPGFSPLKQIKLMIRPEKIIILRPDEGKEVGNIIEGMVQEIIYLGEITKYKIQTILGDFFIKLQNRSEEKRWDVGDRVRIGWEIQDATILLQ